MIIDKNGLTHNGFFDKKIIGAEKVDEISCHILTEDNNAFVFDISSGTINEIEFNTIDDAVNYINNSDYSKEKNVTQRLKQQLKENNMQTHENTNVRQPVFIGKKPFFKSKKYRLNTLDYLKGLLVASLTSALFVVQQLADGGTLDRLSWKPILMAAISGGVGYLIKNLFTDNKTNEKIVK